MHDHSSVLEEDLLAQAKVQCVAEVLANFLNDEFADNVDFDVDSVEDSVADLDGDSKVDDYS